MNRSSSRRWLPPSRPSRGLIVDPTWRVDEVAGLGFLISIHFEATYGYSAPAFDTFAEMLAYWSPRR